MANTEPPKQGCPGVGLVDLALAVWREVSRHLEIAGAVERLAPLLAGWLPVDLILVRGVDLPERGLETAAAGRARPGPRPGLSRSECGVEEFESLLAWCRRGEVWHAQAGVVRERWPGGLPAEVMGDTLVGGLAGQEDVAGLLILMAAGGDAFCEGHERMVAALLEPLGVALENDRRIHEMRRLRDAAEADKCSLLTKLGRRDISDVVIGAENGLRPVMERVEQVAPSDVPVLIFGETGSGKEVIARAIHTRSRRAGGPFLRVSCGAIPPELIDSELFGHERGSFTGAVALRKGWFERSDGGTLFLDEIGELPPPAQVRLLRILQDGTFERVGGQKQLKVDVRTVGATHRDLYAMSRDGRFREDLWYRLAVFPIHLPALRERPEDIAELAAHFAGRACRRFGFPLQVPAPEDIRLLTAYPWPGNVRELAAVIDRAAILGDGRRLDIGKALGVVPAAPAVSGLPQVAPGVEACPAGLGKEGFLTLDAAMARHIEAALKVTHGRVEGRYGAARLLGINPHTLRARMRKLKIDWARFREEADEMRDES
jgi:hydrogenase-4 transcriptional activator